MEDIVVIIISPPRVRVRTLMDKWVEQAGVDEASSVYATLLALGSSATAAALPSTGQTTPQLHHKTWLCFCSTLHCE